jgi:hypothetical protein
VVGAAQGGAAVQDDRARAGVVSGESSIGIMKPEAMLVKQTQETTRTGRACSEESSSGRRLSPDEGHTTSSTGTFVAGAEQVPGTFSDLQPRFICRRRETAKLPSQARAGHLGRASNNKCALAHEAVGRTAVLQYNGCGVPEPAPYRPTEPLPETRGPTVTRRLPVPIASSVLPDSLFAGLPPQLRAEGSWLIAVFVRVATEATIVSLPIYAEVTKMLHYGTRSRAWPLGES